ncbi:MAG: Crp/Fnr family transcriptional regulator [Acidobacteriia bacterium]|nr:Crp/Fnr family transcriptional regulator [Terriglobia bacterium]
MDKTALLKRVPFFHELGETEIAALAQHAVEKTYGKGEFLFAEGDECKGLFVVVRGAVRILKCSASGREQSLDMQLPGTPVAELPLFDGGKYPAAAQCVDEAELLFISRRDFDATLRQHPEIAMAVIRSLSMRLRRMVMLVEELSLKEVSQRLARRLVTLAEGKGRKTGAGVEFELAYSQQEIAAQLGTVRELVSRTLGRFQDEKLISTDGRHITVHSLPELKEIASGLKK